eukprot:m.306233 g.306233  ORF g.306233 m.306233 type:complete len:55 (-) comp16344_c1_seq24:161-325(-)
MLTTHFASHKYNVPLSVRTALGILKIKFPSAFAFGLYNTSDCSWVQREFRNHVP